MKIGIICKISPLPDEGGEHVPHHDGHSHRLTLFLYNSPYFPDIRVVTHTSLWLAFKPSFQPSDWLQHYTRHYCLSLRPTTQTPFTSMSWCCVSKPFLYKNDMRRTTLIILSNTEKNSLCCCAMDCNCWHCSIFYHETKSSSPILIVYSVDWKKETRMFQCSPCAAQHSCTEAGPWPPSRCCSLDSIWRNVTGNVENVVSWNIHIHLSKQWTRSVLYPATSFLSRKVR